MKKLIGLGSVGVETKVQALNKNFSADGKPIQATKNASKLVYEITSCSVSSQTELQAFEYRPGTPHC